MARPLTPAPADLGLASPALGPWFSRDDVRLAAPEPDLSVPFSPSTGTDWLPPARGIFSLHLATASRPPALAGLRNAAGAPAFTDDRLIGLFRLLPEVEVRLAALLAFLPSPDGTAVATPPGPATRHAPRWFAVEFTTVDTTSSLSSLEAVWPHGFAIDEDTEAKKLAAMGLGGASGALTNAARPAAILLGPGEVVASGDKLMALSAVQHRLWTFDALGRALDPGAVAAWLAWLATEEFDNLWAPGVDERTCPVDAARTVTLVGAHQGPVPAALLARTEVGNVGGAASDVVRAAADANAVTIGFSAAPDPDDAPLPRAVLVPSGTAAASLSLWPSGPVATGLERDSARVLLVDVEAHLTGQPRIAAGTTPTAGANRRAAIQNQAASRINVARALRGDAAPLAVAPGLDLAAEALVALLETDLPVTLVTPQIDRDFGPFAPMEAVSAALPDNLPEPEVQALGGGGTGGDTVEAQRVLMTFRFDVALAGAMLRVWPNAVDLGSGRRRAADGGTGRVRSDGIASVVVQLAPGANTVGLLSGVALLAHTEGSRLYGEFRFTRPVASTAASTDWSNATGAIIACEQDRFDTRAAAEAAGLLPGVSLVHDTGTAVSLITAGTAPAPTRSVGARLAAGDRVQITVPAFRAELTGGTATSLAATGATATALSRDGRNRAAGAGTPLPGQRALVSAAAGFDATSARAVLVPPPALARLHEIGPVQLGHPGAPATAEHIGTGAAIEGPAALLVAEALAAHIDTGTPELVAAASARAASAPPDPAGAALWVAALRTEGVGAEGEPGIAAHVDDTSHPYPFDGDEAAQRQWYADHPNITIPAPGANDAAARQRAMARRALAAGRGLQEAAVALSAAFTRAEDFVYIETPAIDLETAGASDDERNPIQALVDRLAAQPALHVVLCVPIQPFSGAPADLVRVRANGLRSAAAALRTAGSDRFALFCPSAGVGRTPRLASSVVLVDDAWGLIGTGDLSRRGLSFDRSLALALFDEVASAGRAETLRRLRRILIGARLGLAPRLVPDEGAALVRALTDLQGRGSSRVSDAKLPEEKTPVTAGDRSFWNRDGSQGIDPVDLAARLQALFTANQLN